MRRFVQKAWTAIPGVANAYPRLTLRLKTLMSHYFRASKASRVPKWALRIHKAREDLFGGHPPQPPPTVEKEKVEKPAAKSNPSSSSDKRPTPSPTAAPKRKAAKPEQCTPFEIPESRILDDDIMSHLEYVYQAPATPTPVVESSDLEVVDETVNISDAPEIPAETVSISDSPTISPPADTVLVDVKRGQSGWDNRKGAWWKGHEGVREFAEDVHGDKNTNKVYGKFGMYVVEILGISTTELEEANQNVLAKYKPSTAADQTKREVIHEGSFITCRRRPSVRIPVSTFSMFVKLKINI